METKPRSAHQSDQPPNPAHPAHPPNPSSPEASAIGLRPTPDPTRSGALWVGGAGVALLLAAAAVLTAVRWDDIGQSAKLGGLVAITFGLLWSGRRFQQAIPMTAQAVFHLGALLIPFDMAAFAILAGQTWQQTLLLTSATSVAAWYAIAHAVPSPVLTWSARGGVIALGAGVASMSPLAMPLLVVGAATAALGLRRHTATITWAITAGFLPLASLITWPPRIKGAMFDLGFAPADRWQLIAAGTTAVLCLATVTRAVPRIELAWTTVVIGATTIVVALAGFSDAPLGFVTLGMAFIALQLMALTARRNILWRPILTLLADLSELLGVAVAAGLFAETLANANATLAAAAALFAVGWLTADRRRLGNDGTDWLTGLLVGSNYALTTVMFPVSALTAVIAAQAPASVASLIATALAYWMVATWRTGATWGALVLGGLAMGWAYDTGMWIELGLGALVAAVFVVATRLRLRAGDPGLAAVMSLAATVSWLIAGDTAAETFVDRWALVPIAAGAWLLSTMIEAGRRPQTVHGADWIGRLAAVLVTGSALTNGPPEVGLVLALTMAAFATGEWFLARQRGFAVTAPLGASVLGLYTIGGGVMLGLAAVPLATLAGFASATTGVALAIASVVVVGIAIAVPARAEQPLAAVAVTLAALGLGLASASSASMAIALIAVGTAVVLVGAAARDLVIAAVGFITVGLGVSLQLVVWNVEWLEPYLVLPAVAALVVGHRYHRTGGSSWVAYVPTIAIFSFVSIMARLEGGSAWHAVIAGTIGVGAIIAGGYRRLAGPLITGTVVLAIVTGYEALGPAALVPTWAWLAIGGTVLLGSGIAMERSDTTPLEKGQQLRNVVATQFS